MTESDFTARLKTALRTAAENVEKLRTAYMAALVCGVGIVSFAVTFAILYINPPGVDLRYTVTCGALLPSALVYLVLNGLYRPAGAKRLLAVLCARSGLESRRKGCFTASSVTAHKILPEYNRDSTETGIRGRYRDTPLAVQEIVLTALKQDPAHASRQKEYLRFWGLLVRISLTRPAEGHTVIVPRIALKAFFGGGFSGYRRLPPAANDRFDKIYDILATDPLEAKFIANAVFRDRFLAAIKTMRAYWAEVSIRDREILLAFQRFRPLFPQTPLWKPVAADSFHHFAEEMQSIAALIDILKTNPQVGI